jgi:hypothetical protein
MSNPRVRQLPRLVGIQIFLHVTPSHERMLWRERKGGKVIKPGNVGRVAAQPHDPFWIQVTQL